MTDCGGAFDRCYMMSAAHHRPPPTGDLIGPIGCDDTAVVHLPPSSVYVASKPSTSVVESPASPEKRDFDTSL